ncbi:CPBP family intramembrane metalloprotease [Bacillus sp. N3536]|nr:CPBP family intramembrane metalloprotease [Bacillus sp. N3536]
MKQQKTGLYILITYCVMQLSGALFAPLLLIIFNYFGLENARYLASGWWVFLGMGIATVITLLMIRQDKNFIRPLKGKASGLPGAIGWGILGFLMVLYGQTLAANIEIRFFGIEAGSENTSQFMDLGNSVPFVFFSIVLFAPILEELIFRRIIFGTLLPKTNFFVAALVSSLSFAVIHFEFTHILIYAVSGFIFAFIYYKTKRIITSIIAHMLLNGFVVIVQLYNEEIVNFLKRLAELQQ